MRIFADVTLEILRQNSLDRSPEGLSRAEKVGAGHENCLAAIAAAVAAHSTGKGKGLAGFDLILLEPLQVFFSIGHTGLLPLFRGYLNCNSDLLPAVEKTG